MKWSKFVDSNGFWGVMNVAGMLWHLVKYCSNYTPGCMNLCNYYKNKLQWIFVSCYNNNNNNRDMIKEKNKMKNT